MYLIENEYKRNLAATIAEKDRYFAAMQKTYQKTLAEERKAHQKALSELAELKRRFGVS